MLGRQKQNSSYSSSENSDSSDDSGYRRKRRKDKKGHLKKDHIKLCARLTERLLEKVCLLSNGYSFIIFVGHNVTLVTRDYKNSWIDPEERKSVV